MPKENLVVCNLHDVCWEENMWASIACVHSEPHTPEDVGVVGNLRRGNGTCEEEYFGCGLLDVLGCKRDICRCYPVMEG